ncbi:uncharacterized protein MONBRDRAFT_36138 [Monosiga brevicollis MX1]|uniref:Autophagy-related protein 2 n=1 Tax=Monosiga brevicollis TaxID=81824 RepID=A9UTB0_MONBE|nr:uncharacterized protein MONBRDRAFT_36138 [Monosiga brevicollis MX1]EDQ91214.1 predicted protein [Monosiga brevicollis MX1]|eukprot:XP_001743636.1 hypothetical protein [Monosiga brevicollis MX1]
MNASHHEAFDDAVRDLEHAIEDFSGTLAQDIQGSQPDVELSHVAVVVKRILSRLRGQLRNVTIRLFSASTTQSSDQAMLLCSLSSIEVLDVSREATAVQRDAHEAEYDAALAAELRKQVRFEGLTISLEHGHMAQDLELVVTHSQPVLSSIDSNDSANLIEVIYRQAPRRQLKVEVFLQRYLARLDPAVLHQLALMSEVWAFAEDQGVASSHSGPAPAAPPASLAPAHAGASAAVAFDASVRIMDLVAILSYAAPSHDAGVAAQRFQSNAAWLGRHGSSRKPTATPAALHAQLPEMLDSDEAGLVLALSQSLLRVGDGGQAQLELTSEAVTVYDCAGSHNCRCLLRARTSTVEQLSASDSVTSDAVPEDALTVRLPRESTAIEVRLAPDTFLQLDLSLLDRLQGLLNVAGAQSSSSLPPKQPGVAQDEAPEGLHIVVSGGSLDAVVLVPINSTARHNLSDGWLHVPSFRAQALHARLEDFVLHFYNDMRGSDWQQDCLGLPIPGLERLLQIEAQRLTLGHTPTQTLTPTKVVALRGAATGRDGRAGLRVLGPGGKHVVAPAAKSGFPMTMRTHARTQQQFHEPMSEEALWAFAQAALPCSLTAVTVHHACVDLHCEKAQLDELYQLATEMADWVMWSDVQANVTSGPSAPGLGEPTIVSATPAASSESTPNLATSVWAAPAVDGESDAESGEDDQGTPAEQGRSVAGDVVVHTAHKMAFVLEFAELDVSVVESHPERSGVFDVRLSRGQLLLLLGMQGSQNMSLALRGEQPYVAQRAVVGNPNDRFDVITPVYAEAEASPSVFSICLCAQAANTSQVQARTTVACLLQGAQFRYFVDPQGLWLFRILDLLDFPDHPGMASTPKATTSAKDTLTVLNVFFEDSEVVYQPYGSQAALLTPVARVTVSSNLYAATPITVVSILLEEISVLAIDDVRKLQRGQDWQARGWRKLAFTTYTRLDLRLSDVSGEIAQDFGITNELLSVYVCADSLPTLVELLSGAVGGDDEYLAEQVENLARVAAGDTSLPSTRTASSGSAEQALPSPLAAGPKAADALEESGGDLFFSIMSDPDDVADATSEPTATTFAAQDASSSRASDAAEEVLDEYDDDFEEDEDQDTEAEMEASLVHTRSRAPRSPTVEFDDTLIAELEMMDDGDEAEVERNDDGTERSGLGLHARGSHLDVSASPSTASLDSFMVSEMDRGDGAGYRHPAQVPPAVPGATDSAAIQQDLSDALVEPLSDSADDTSQARSASGLPLEGLTALRLDEDYLAQTFESGAAVPDMPDVTSVLHDALLSPSRTVSHPNDLNTPTGTTPTASIVSYRGHERVGAMIQDGGQPADFMFQDEDSDLVVRKFVDPISFKRNFFTIPKQDDDADFRAYDFLPLAKRRVLIKRLNIKVHLIRGRHWQDVFPDDLDPVGQAAGFPRVAPSLLTSSSQTAPKAGVDDEGSNQGPRVVRESQSVDNEGLEIDLHQLTVISENYDQNELYASRLLVLSRQINVFDRLPESVVNMLLCDYTSRHVHREASSNMLRMELMTVRTPEVTGEAALEAMMKLRILPLRINLDQDTLNFLMEFLAFAPRGSEAAQRADLLTENWQQIDIDDNSGQPVELSSAPADAKPARVSDQESRLTAQTHATLSEGSNGSETQQDSETSDSASDTSSAQVNGTYFKKVLIEPVLLCVNYAPKHLSVSELFHGSFEQLAGVISLNDAKLYLSPLTVKGFREGVTDGIRVTAVEMCSVATAMVFAVQNALELSQDGLQQAYDALRRSIAASYDKFASVPERARQTTVMKSIALLLRTLPSATLQPLIGVCEATALALQGARNSLAPRRGQELAQQYKPL